MSSSSGNSSGIGLFGVVGIVFVILKFTGVINWSWWLVTLPFYGGLIIALVLLLIFAVLMPLFNK